MESDDLATTNYNLPTITGNMNADVVRDMNALAEATDTAIKTAVDGVDLSAVEGEIATVSENLATHLADEEKHLKAGERTSWTGKYTKPGLGIPKTDLVSAVQTSLNKADTSVQNTEKGAANGVATLDSSKRILLSQIPDLSSLGIGKIVFGEYIGDGTNGRTIDVGMPIKAVIIYASDVNNRTTYVSQTALGMEGFHSAGGSSNSIVSSSSGVVPRVNGNSFILTSYPGLNIANHYFKWIAFG